MSLTHFLSNSRTPRGGVGRQLGRKYKRPVSTREEDRHNLTFAPRVACLVASLVSVAPVKRGGDAMLFVSPESTSVICEREPTCTRRLVVCHMQQVLRTLSLKLWRLSLEHGLHLRLKINAHLSTHRSCRQHQAMPGIPSSWTSLHLRQPRRG